MTGITAIPKTAPAVSGLTANGDTAGTGVMLKWTQPNDPEFYSTEIWVAESNDRASAAKIATITGSSFLYIGTPGITYYFWIRSVNIYNSSSGTWHPLSNTAGVSGLVGLITTTDIAPGAVTASAFNFTAGPIVGAGGTDYIGVISFNAANASTSALPVVVSHACLQSYSGGAVTTKWLIYNITTSAIIADFGQFVDKIPLPYISAAFAVPSFTTHNIGIFWWGADNTVSISDRTTQLMGFMR